jgi:DtxR family transcriptional regulator, Mn-dependent transcriptional regulator
MSDLISDSIQDYLKSIYDLTEGGQPASTKSLALRLGVKPASVTGMLQKLASLNPPLVNYHKHQGVKLTGKGRRAALEVIRHHRLLESWLVQTLGYSWDEVHIEAEKLEHVISEDFETRIAAATGYPERDPHGDLIPSANLIMPKDESVSLSSLESEQEATIRRVDAQDPEFLRHLEELGLIPGARVKIYKASLYDHVMHVQVRGRKEAIILGPAITERVFVETL